MAVDEIIVRLRARLQEEYGVDEAAILMDRPPGGWGDLVTNDTLRRELAGLEQRLDEKLELKIDWVRSELGSEITQLRSELGSEIGLVRSELGSEIGLVRSELGSEIGLVRSEAAQAQSRIEALLHRELRAQARWMVTTTIGCMSFLVAAMGLLVGLAQR